MSRDWVDLPPWDKNEVQIPKQNLELRARLSIGKREICHCYGLFSGMVQLDSKVSSKHFLPSQLKFQVPSVTPRHPS